MFTNHQDFQNMDSPDRASGGHVSRLTIVESLYYETSDNTPYGVDTRMCRTVSGKEQPYVRHKVVGASWEMLDTGWIGKDLVDTIVISNKGSKRVPTMIDGSNTVLVSFDQGNTTHLIVYPNDSLRLCVDKLSDICIRSKDIDINCTINVFPK